MSIYTLIHIFIHLVVLTLRYLHLITHPLSTFLIIVQSMLFINAAVTRIRNYFILPELKCISTKDGVLGLLSIVLFSICI
jgi:hypothetical protein